MDYKGQKFQYEAKTNPTKDKNYNNEDPDTKRAVIVSPNKDISNDRVITDENLKFFDENGYLVVRNLVPDQLCDDVVSAIWSFLGASPSNPTEWYRPPATRGGMVEIYHHPAMWNTRQHPRLYKAFAELWNTGKLWVSIDRACFKTPSNPNFPDYESNGFVHWDLDPWNRDQIPFGLQGVLVLEDTEENQGGFHCVPGMHKTLSQWTDSIQPPAAREKFYSRQLPILVPKTALKKMNVKKIPAKKGDFIIWRRELAHGNGHNISGKPRLAQYINMFPERGDSTEKLSSQATLHPETRVQRLEMFENRVGPFHKPCDSRYHEQKVKQDVHLTDLGKKLLGSELWDD